MQIKERTKIPETIKKEAESLSLLISFKIIVCELKLLSTECKTYIYISCDGINSSARIKCFCAPVVNKIREFSSRNGVLPCSERERKKRA